MGLDPSVKGLHNVIICEDGEAEATRYLQVCFSGLTSKNSMIH